MGLGPGGMGLLLDRLDPPNPSSVLLSDVARFIGGNVLRVEARMRDVAEIAEPL